MTEQFFTDKITTNAAGGSQSDTPVRMDLIPPDTLLKVAAVLNTGAEKYGEDNWKLIPAKDHINHAIAHMYGYLAGDRSEQHLLNAVCRSMFAAHMSDAAPSTNDFVTKIKEFNEVYSLDVCAYEDSDRERDVLIIGLIQEELAELEEAHENNTGCFIDQVDVAPIQDALGDLLYVVLGAAIRWNFDIAGIFNEVHRSNMSKLDDNGKPIYRDDGKLLKGPDYSEPTLGDKYCL